MVKNVVGEATSSMHMACYVSDELDEWLQHMIPLAADPAVKDRLQKSLQLSAERRSRRARMLNI